MGAALVHVRRFFLTAADNAIGSRQRPESRADVSSAIRKASQTHRMDYDGGWCACSG